MWKHIGTAALVAIFVQWGSQSFPRFLAPPQSFVDQLTATGPAILIAYLTPSKGIGCRTGAYIIYGVIATIAWLLLALSSCLSHAMMLHHQRVVQKIPFERFQATQNGGQANAGHRDPKAEAPEAARPDGEAPADDGARIDPADAVRTELRSARLRLLALAAAGTRWLGKLLVIVNTVWIVLASLLQYVGGFDNCWCKSNAPGLGWSGFVVLFLGAPDLALTAQLPWAVVCIPLHAFGALVSTGTNECAQGVVLSVLVCTLSLLFFGLAK